MTLAELLVGAAITTTVVGTVMSAVLPAQRSFAVHQESADVRQRVRVTVETIAADLRAAGLVLPYRSGPRGDGPVTGVFHRPATIGILFESAEAYASGVVVPGVSANYYVADGDGDGQQVMRYDGVETTMPLADNVARLTFELFGDAQPPRRLPMNGTETTVPVTYGPSPPDAAADDAGDTWGVGENCTFALVNGQHEPRLDVLAGGAIVLLTPSQLTDGPWCPDSAHAFRFDADLLRVRRVRMRLRMQPTATFRSRDSDGGRAVNGRVVPDEEIVVDVAPRNLGVTR